MDILWNVCFPGWAYNSQWEESGRGVKGTWCKIEGLKWKPLQSFQISWSEDKGIPASLNNQHFTIALVSHWQTHCYVEEEQQWIVYKCDADLMQIYLYLMTMFNCWSVCVHYWLCWEWWLQGGQWQCWCTPRQSS